MILPGVGWSDHWSFWKRGYRALMVTDTAPFRYPHYHQPTDTPDKIDFERTARVVEGIEAAVRDLAGLDRGPAECNNCTMTQMSNYPLGGRRCCRQLQKTIPPGFFRALSDPTRLDLLVQLAGCRRACTVGELAECCPVDLSVVSRHLAILRDAGLLESTRRGKQVYYRVRFDMVAGTLRAVADAVERCCADETTC